MLSKTTLSPHKIICTGRVTIKLFRIETDCEVEYRFTVECDSQPEDALTLGELRMIEDLVRENMREAEAAAANELNLEKLSLFPRKKTG